MMANGEISEEIAPGIDGTMLLQPVGVCATICPFNFPAMIPFWYLPYAIACGNAYIIKPSEKVPMTMKFIFKLIEQIDYPNALSTWSMGRRKRWMPFWITRSSSQPLSVAQQRLQVIYFEAPPRRP
ncbi:MAG: aldehyde dehydrogenase family protein [Chloroflexi bacterium]|nr:MAG: aldehyde dehydrogenase family protein [Chloroflexota bacterium]